MPSQGLARRPVITAAVCRQSAGSGATTAEVDGVVQIPSVCRLLTVGDVLDLDDVIAVSKPPGPSCSCSPS
jgi:hypothetical protein